MTTGNWIELLVGSQSNSVAAFALLLTLLSGYTVIAYVVGEKLTRLQLVVANVLYIAGASITLGGIHTSVTTAAKARFYLSSSVMELEYTTSLEHMLMAANLVVIIDAALVLAPLIFMWQIRHPKEK